VLRWERKKDSFFYEMAVGGKPRTNYGEKNSNPEGDGISPGGKNCLIREEGTSGQVDKRLKSERGARGGTEEENPSDRGKREKKAIASI